MDPSLCSVSHTFEAIHHASSHQDDSHLQINWYIIKGADMVRLTILQLKVQIMSCIKQMEEISHTTYHHAQSD